MNSLIKLKYDSEIKVKHPSKRVESWIANLEDLFTMELRNSSINWLHSKVFCSKSPNFVESVFNKLLDEKLNGNVVRLFSLPWIVVFKYIVASIGWLQSL